MRIAQISDIHIGGPHEMPHNIDVRQQFSKVVDAVCTLKPDVIMLSGDQSYEDAKDESYLWISGLVKQLPCTIYALAGNHDRQDVMRKYFDVPYHPETQEIYYALSWMGIPVLCLDTARGVMSDQQFDWLRLQLEPPAPQTIIFMHHPPAYCGVPHMDERYAFQQIPELQNLFSNVATHFRIFCGHYHVERSLFLSNQEVHITPSTFFQIDATRKEFRIDHTRPGYRLIEISEDGHITTRCQYL